MADDKATRITGEAVTIDAEAVRAFFDLRGGRIDPQHPYTSILYQDRNPSLAERRDAHEKNVIRPLLGVNETSHVLDIGCGIGRWADALLDSIASYVGIDFNENLIRHARGRLNDRAELHVMPAANISSLRAAHSGKFDLVIISGLLLYLNDTEVTQLIVGLPPLCRRDCRIYIREPLALGDRLTLDRFWSDDLAAEYSSIYRTQYELNAMLSPLCAEGFRRKDFTPLYDDDSLNNRSETKQFVTFLDRGHLS